MRFDIHEQVREVLDRLDAADMPAARLTAWWKGQAPQMRAALDELFAAGKPAPVVVLVEGDDATVELHPSEFRRAFEVSVGFCIASGMIRRASAARAAALDASGDPAAADFVRSHALSADRVRETFGSEFVPRLVEAAMAQAPRLARMLGPDHLPDFLAALVLGVAALRAGARDFETALADFAAFAPMTIEHLVGNNPVRIVANNADGSVVTDIPAEATGRHELDLRSYRRSLGAERRPGRPATAKPKAKGAPRPRISDEAIADTGRLSVDAWAASHAPDCDLSDKRQAKIAGAPFDRARHHRLNRERFTN